MSAMEELRVRVIGFLNANASELGEIALQAFHAHSAQKSIHAERYDRRVLSEFFMRELIAGTAKRRDLNAGDVDTFAKQATELADALIRANEPRWVTATPATP